MILADIYNPLRALTSGTGGLITLIHLIIWVIFALEIVQSGRPLLNKVFWILLILFFPVGGLILYFLFGR